MQIEGAAVQQIFRQLGPRVVEHMQHAKMPGKGRAGLQQGAQGLALTIGVQEAESAGHGCGRDYSSHSR